VEAATDNHLAPKPLGQVLSEERERQGLTRLEAAQRLHMSAYQVEALETGDYARLPKGTFLRGFVRNYAKALGLDPNAILARLAEGGHSTPAPGIVVPSQNIRFDPMNERLANPYIKAGALAVVAVTLLAAAMYWWLFIRPAPPAVAKKPAESVEPAKPAPRTQLAVPPVQAPEPVVPMQMQAPVAVEPAKPEPPKAEAAKPAPIGKAEPAKPAPVTKAELAKPAPITKTEPPKIPAASLAESKALSAPPRAPGAKVIRMRFKGDSWVEVRDAQGKVLMSRVNPKGSETEVEGRPPLSVIVGNASDVEVKLDDREFPLAPHTKVAVARFTVE
jgi:cytoskeleton protein RodZ